ncbi:elongation factor G-binding protein [Bacillus sp. AFS076308]|uniref:FusB/FusC family EF-G-binding protein n=1 Tax=unclassified Bacillus (in: firmicutes) TaxID=185979 RepID=UPI000BF49D10|nr:MULTISPECIES: FusB/FusC family EF-G-binding protein [unclassified Bacillus (in: firmicutes)]PFO06570.1 elongation factor G-binding protein [Bacillus sp. AFS076308]PGV52877.1 elongation factor G-binding protein [Bacillus sp. AFS037270]
MTEKFIKNEQLNFIKKQIAMIKDSAKKNIPPNVLAAVIDLANAKILDLISNASLDQQEMLDLSRLKTDAEYEQYIQRLSDYLVPFPKITEEQLKKMFPKNKKLKRPDLSEIDHNQLTYLSWNDLRSNKKFIVYELDGKMVGIECNFAPTSKNNICSICNSFSEVAYFSTVTKSKKSKNPDYYKAIGNLICADSSECNKKITNVDYLTTFLKDSLGM